jgi:hypothetical protein
MRSDTESETFAAALLITLAFVGSLALVATVAWKVWPYLQRAWKILN